ncbi:TorF family putative porin [Sphingosinicella rhizophila]|uniref:TorF family putative porin n=1 Tax=Sphingosinicella rhizophila TaxID=3050082 RepID=A0ABU3QAD1_9SPHN|nr:TorF family putative porin [Sphingosinicella sp. GR2756]MDT9599953.1 TorF family putative porin [Sphingosinicella sp. GR2756]
MRVKILVLSSAFGFGLAASPAVSAQEVPGEFTVSGGATIVSDYRFRGISQTDKRFAVQGTLGVSHISGFYASVWGSSIDDYVYNGADQEINFIAGYRRTFGGTTIDAGILYYYYPGSGGISSDFFEPYASVAHTIGPVTGKLTANYAPKQSALSVGTGKEDNLYVAADLSAGIPNTPVGLTAHFGHSFGPSYLTIGDEYSDWGLGVTYTWNRLTFGLNYVDTNGTFMTPSGRNASKAGIVGSASVSF